MSKKVLYSLIGVLVVVILAGIVVMARKPRTDPNISAMTDTEMTTHVNDESSNMNQTATSSVMWQNHDDGWKASGKVPECPDPLTLKTPVDLSLASAILYPGQTRGGNYKPHGGFIFHGQKNDAITITAPMDATVTRGSRYNEIGEVQHLFEFVAPCGIAYRFDHLHTLSPTFQKIADTFPAPSDSSETHNLVEPMTVKAGDVIATAVGFVNAGNTSVDWGVYDLRSKNASSENATWVAQHQDDNELAPYAVCWFDWLSAADAATVKGLPAGDGQNGKTSDYCK